MLQDPNVERYVQKQIEPLQEQIKELQATMFKLMQANNLHLQNVNGSFSKYTCQSYTESCGKCPCVVIVGKDEDEPYLCPYEAKDNIEWSSENYR
jgi:endonuclease III